jgi:iron complex outermembrane receptor protein
MKSKRWARIGKRALSCCFLSSASILTLGIAQTASGQEVATPIPDISVTAPTGQVADGSANAGYRVDTVTNVGPFTNMKLQDTPYSYNVLSSEFLQNTGNAASIGANALDKSPFFAISGSEQRGVIGLGSQRGIANGQDNNFFRVDGLPTVGSFFTYGLEQFDRIEILSGVSSFMYGVNANAGSINFTLKRPTPTPYFSAELGTPDGHSGYGHVDVGSTSKDGAFGYRINVAGNLGDTAVDNQNIRRYLVSGAFDWRPTDRMLLQFDASHSDWRINGLSPTWIDLNDPPVGYPAVVPDNSKLWSQPWSYAYGNATTLGPKMTWEVTDWFTLRSSARYSESEYALPLTIQNRLRPGGTTFVQSITAQDPSIYKTFAKDVYGDFKFDTFSVKHKLTVGWSGSERDQISTDGFDRATSPAFPLSSPPPYYPAPALDVGTNPFYTYAKQTLSTFSVGDQIEFNRYFTAIVGASQAKVSAGNFDLTGLQTSHYDASKWTPTYALLVKPVDWLTVYGSYIESLQQGLIVNSTNATNNHEVLPPYLRTQYEFGAKATVGNALFTLAYFNIDSALQYTIPAPNNMFTYVQSGRQVSDGIEVSVTGKITDSFRVLGGVMFAHSRVTKNESDPTLNGLVPELAVEQIAKVTAEYDLPFVRGLTLVGGAYHTGGQYADAANLEWVPGHTTFDAGLRYATQIEGHKVVARLYVSNITDKNYWIGINNLGQPRTVSFSVQTTW